MLCEVLLENAPNYFYVVAASSTGKYHPQYALGNGGLVRHTIAAVNFLNYLLTLEQYSFQFTDREKDYMRAAMLLHDTEKLGRNGSQYTVFDHPLLAAKTVRGCRSNIPFEWCNLLDEELEIIAACIETHMGEWNTSDRNSLVLPKPQTEMQKLVHLADYLASRKNVEFIFDESVEEAIEMAKPDINTYIMPFGKYKGQLLIDVDNEHHDYIIWLVSNCNLQEPLASLIKDIS